MTTRTGQLFPAAQALGNWPSCEQWVLWVVTILTWHRAWGSYVYDWCLWCSMDNACTETYGPSDFWNWHLSLFSAQNPLILVAEASDFTVNMDSPNFLTDWISPSDLRLHLWLHLWQDLQSKCLWHCQYDLSHTGILTLIAKSQHSISEPY